MALDTEDLDAEEVLVKARLAALSQQVLASPPYQDLIAAQGALQMIAELRKREAAKAAAVEEAEAVTQTAEGEPDFPVDLPVTDTESAAE